MALLIPAATAARPVDAASERWFLVETASFDVLGNLPAAEVVDHAVLLEALYGALEQLNEGRVRLPPIPPRVVLLASDDWFERYAPSRMSSNGTGRSSGYYHSGEYLDHLVVRAGARAEPLRTLFHEAMHAFVHHNVPSAPLWLNEGLAELYSTLRIDRTEEGIMATLGEPRLRHLQTLRGGETLGWRTLLETDAQTRLYHQGDRRSLFYAQSWALVHYLLLGRKDGGVELREMLRALEGGASSLDAFTDAFDSLHDLDGELTRHLGSPLPRIRFPLDLSQVAVSEPAQVAPAVAVRMLGELWLSAGGRDAARRHFDTALDLDPGHARALAALGQLAEQRGDLETARSWYEQAVEADAGDPWGHFLLGQGVVRAAVDREFRPEEIRRVARARESLRRCTDAWPAFGPAWAALGLSWLVVPGEPDDEALRALRRAAELQPERGDVVFHLTMAHVLRSEWQQARGVLRGELTHRDADGELARRAERALAHGRVEQAARQVDAGAPTAGALLDDLESDPDPALSELAPRLAEIRRVYELNRAVGLYNQALEAAQQGNVSQARRLAQRAAASTTDRELRRAARSLLRQLEP